MALTTDRTAQFLAAAAELHLTPVAARRVADHLLDRDADWYLDWAGDPESAALHELGSALVTTDDDFDDFRAELDARINRRDCDACGYFTGHTSWCPNATPATDRLMGTVHADHCHCRRCTR